MLRLPSGELLAIGIESHNHPSYVDPHNGAATGVGGIVRDVLSMGARPVALGDPLRFGPLGDEKNRYLLEHVVEGISSYGNSIGVPVVTGDLEVNGSYQGNPLVNVTCIGLVSEERLVRGRATGPGNSLVLLGSSTGRDGLGGASFASRELDEEAEEESQPSVQIGDPFTERLLIEACREITRRRLALSMRDLGAAGLGGASSELCHAGSVGLEIHLDRVHQREEGMAPWEILVSESQERMLVEVEPGRVEEVREVAEKYDLPCVEVGRTTKDHRYRAIFEGRVVCDVDLDLLVEGASMYDREKAERVSPPERRPPDVPTEDAVRSLLASPNVAGKGWVHSQYDHDVQVRTVTGPGDDAAVLRLDEGGLVFSAGGNGFLVKADPLRGGALVLAEHCRRVAAMGGTPLGFVDCLNFGSPERPGVFREFSDAVQGMAEAAADLNVPVLGGNVSFYNESEEKGTAVNPSPTVGVVGWMEDPADRTESAVTEEGLTLALAGGSERLGGSEFLRLHGGTDEAPGVDLKAERELVEKLPAVDAEATRCVSRGGVVSAVTKMCVAGGTGATIDLTGPGLFAERGVVVATGEPDTVLDALPEARPIGETGGDAVEGPGFSLHLDEARELLSSLTGVMRPAG
ncbi:MAG: Phosphoribosylformylglycinamidine synthase subunit PurL [Methanonatronarchaeales archaeon]|nr:Phosphoribosylformylglycinamidine synthase subunit PurL [Methanonatronarchaeales archaeon]